MSRARDTADQINRVNSSAADANAITVDGTKVGIGTTPSATYSAFDTIEFNTASIISQNTATGGASPDGNLVLGSNMNYSSGGGPEYKVTGKATQITQVDGNITLGVATSGTANTNITYNTGLEVLNDGYARAKNGLLFGTDTAAANALSDYEEGAFTPSLDFGSGNTGMTLSASGKYLKVGHLVTVWIYIYVTNKGTSTGHASVGGLPFAINNPVGVFSPLGDRGRINTGGEGVSAYISSGSAFSLYSGGFDGGQNASVTSSNFQNTSEVDIVTSYFTNS
jgi:hypothetical protein